MQALQSLQRGLRAAEIELWVKPPGGAPRCVVSVDADNEAHPEPADREDGSDAALACSQERSRPTSKDLSAFDLEGRGQVDRHFL